MAEVVKGRNGKSAGKLCDDILVFKMEIERVEAKKTEAADKVKAKGRSEFSDENEHKVTFVGEVATGTVYQQNKSKVDAVALFRMIEKGKNNAKKIAKFLAAVSISPAQAAKIVPKDEVPIVKGSKDTVTALRVEKRKDDV